MVNYYKMNFIWENDLIKLQSGSMSFFYDIIAVQSFRFFAIFHCFFFFFFNKRRIKLIKPFQLKAKMVVKISQLKRFCNETRGRRMSNNKCLYRNVYVKGIIFSPHEGQRCRNDKLMR